MISQPSKCEEVQIAAMARLDGERVGLSSDEIDMHIARCRTCAIAIGEIRALHADLTRIDYEPLDVDLWPAVERNLDVVVRRRTPREGRTILALAIVLIAWRLAQLLFGLPGPVVNSVVPLAIVVIVLRWIAGDPFAIQASTHQLQQKGAS
jgi:predicted anti-sigma-YlaC factor YlaD